MDEDLARKLASALLGNTEPAGKDDDTKDSDARGS
jgi:hypothetical protein